MSSWIPLLPQTPVRSWELNGCPATLYFSLAAAICPLFWHRGHVFQPGPAVTSGTSVPGSLPMMSFCAIDACGHNAAMIKAKDNVVRVVFRIGILPLLEYVF